MDAMRIVLINSSSLFSSEMMSSNSYFKESICRRPGTILIAVPQSVQYPRKMGISYAGTGYNFHKKKWQNYVGMELWLQKANVDPANIL